MKASSFKWLLGMCVPVVVFGGVATYLSRVQPAALRDDGPFQLVVEGVRHEKLTASDAQQGKTAIFQVVLNARGEKPSWWGQSTSGRCGGDQQKYENARMAVIREHSAKNWQGPYTAFTAEWNQEMQRYHARVEVEAQPPRDAAVRWRGKVQLGHCNDPALTELTAFDVQLKKAGEQWPQEKFSRDAGMVIRSVNIVRVDAKNYRTEITFFVPRDETPGFSMKVDFVDNKSQHLSLHDKNGYLTPLFYSTTCCTSATNSRGAYIESKRLRAGLLSWKTYDMQRAPREVTAKILVINYENWPLELTFPVKKNGQLLQGKVPIQTRPAPIQRD